MYDKTVAGIHKIYVVTGSGSYDTVFDLLSPDAQLEIESLLTETGAHQYKSHDPNYSNKQNVRRLIVDGYLRYQSGQLLVATSKTPGDAVETLQEDEIYPTPVINWIYDTYINAPNGAKVIVRLFFS